MISAVFFTNMFFKGIQCGDQAIGQRLLVMASIALAIFLLLRLFRPFIRKYKSAWRDLLRVVKIQMDFWQVTSAMNSTMPAISFPGIWLAFINNFSFVNFDFSAIFGLQCVDGISFYTSFVLISLMPLIAISIGIAKFQYRKFVHLKQLLEEKLRIAEIDAEKKLHKNKSFKEKENKEEDKKEEEITRALTDKEKRAAIDKQKAIDEGLRIAFNIADKDNSGFIDVHEFATLVRNLGFKKFQDKHAQKLFAKRSKDGDLFLDQEEFIELVLDPHNKVHIDTEVIAWSAQRRDMYHAFADVSQLLLLVHTPVARSFFTFFDCVDVSGKMLLKQDMSLLCGDDDYNGTRIFVMFVGILFVIGFPLCIGVYLVLHRNELYAVRVTDKIGFLYDRFHKGSEFWELHELVRKVILTGVAVTLAGNPTFQVLMASFVCVIAQVNLNYFKPHKNKVVYFIAQTCFLSITLKYMVALLLTGNEAATKDPQIGPFLIGLDITTSSFGVLGLFLAFWLLYKKIKLINKERILEESGSNTKVLPIDAEAESTKMLDSRAALMEELTNFVTMPVVSTTEKMLRSKLKELVDVDKSMYNLLMSRTKFIDDLRTKLNVVQKQMAENSNKSGSGQLKDLKEQLYKAQLDASGVSASGVGQRAVTLVSLLRQLFRKFDPNATGHLGQPELRDLFLHIMNDTPANRRSAEADAMTVINSVDTDGNGTVEEGEFVEWIQKGIAIPYEKRIAWGSANKTQERLLNFLTCVITYCQDTYLKSIFLEFDRDGDQALSKSELVALMVEMKMRSTTQSDLSTSLKSIASDAGIVLLALDLDGNGKIDLEELTDWLTEGLSRPLDERKKFALQGGVYKRLELFLVSVEETAEKSGLTQWRWALKNNESGGQARFVATGSKGTNENGIKQEKKKLKAGIPHQKTRKISKIQKPEPPPLPKKKDAVPKQNIKKKKTIKKKEIKQQVVIDVSKYYVDASDVTEDEFISLFSLYDVDGTGGIDGNEMLTMMDSRKKSLGMFKVKEKDCTIIMKALDTDGNGQVDSKEFAAWIKAGLTRTPQERYDWAHQNSTCRRLDAFLSAVHKDVLDRREEGGSTGNVSTNETKEDAFATKEDASETKEDASETKEGDGKKEGKETSNADNGKEGVDSKKEEGKESEMKVVDVKEVPETE
jgi:Ca2+-binding EF-hand superfamily protein